MKIFSVRVAKVGLEIVKITRCHFAIGLSGQVRETVPCYVCSTIVQRKQNNVGFVLNLLNCGKKELSNIGGLFFIKF